MCASADHQDERAPIVAAGLRWLYDTEQPRDALLQPGGVALPPVRGRWYIFAPGLRSPGAAIVVHPGAPGDSDPVKELDMAELSGLAATVTQLAGIGARVTSATPRMGRIDLDAAAHPSLVDAVRRYLSGCPPHRQKGCGHARGAQAPCRWYADGFSRLIQPVVLPRDAAADGDAESAPEAAPQPPALRTANELRRDHGARKAVELAQRAIVALSNKPHRRAVTEEALAVLRLRVAHPDLSLRELAALHEPPITKDTYSARLRRALLSEHTPHGQSANPKSTTAA